MIRKSHYSITRLAPLVLSFFIATSLPGQYSFIDFGENERPDDALFYDSAKACFSTLLYKTYGYGNFSSRAAYTDYRRIDFNENRQLTDTALTHFSAPGNDHYFRIKYIEGWPGHVLALRHDLTQPGGVNYYYSFKGNCDLCELRNDSLINCQPLLPTDAYTPSLVGIYNSPQEDSVHVFMKWSTGNGGVNLDRYRLRINKTNQGVKYNKVNLINGANEVIFDLVNPLRMADGTWLMKGVEYESTSLSANLYRVNSSWDSIISSASTNYFNQKTAYLWPFGDKVVVLHPSWKTHRSLHSAPTLHVYDTATNTIEETYYIDIPGEEEDPPNQTMYYNAIFNGEHFVFTGTSSKNHIAGEEYAMFICVLDTNFDVVASEFIKDPQGGDFLGAIFGIARHPVSKHYYYTGALANDNLTGDSGQSDLMLGKLAVGDIGIDESIRIRKKETWMYPNPSDGRFTLENKAAQFEPYEIKIFDVNGKEVFTQEVKSAKADISADLANGQYFLSTSGGEVLPFLIK